MSTAPPMDEKPAEQLLGGDAGGFTGDDYETILGEEDSSRGYIGGDDGRSGAESEKIL
jgi:hypothetical protein